MPIPKAIEDNDQGGLRGMAIAVGLWRIESAIETLSRMAKAIQNGCQARLSRTAARQGYRERLPVQAEAIENGRQSRQRLSRMAASPGYRERLPGKAIENGCRDGYRIGYRLRYRDGCCRSVGTIVIKSL
jgi:hypothetical protein